MTINERPEKTKEVIPPTPESFKGKQLELFKTFLCNDGQREEFSNALMLWDSIPRYALSRQQQDKWRKAGTFPLLHDVPFNYQGVEFKASIQPAAIRNKDGHILGYYPSANEELIEDALRKIAIDQLNGFLDQPNTRSGVVFTLHMLREEMKRRGHTRSYQEIVLSLNILVSSIIEIRTAGGKKGEGFAKSAYFQGLSAVSANKLADDPHAKWMVQFHPLVTQAINTLTYRQYNYARMMSLSKAIRCAVIGCAEQSEAHRS